MKASTLFFAVAAVALSAAAASAQPIAIGPASTTAVFISKSDFANALASRQAGTGVAGLGATRAGDDRINVDVLKRTDPKGEGPVTHDIVTEVYYIIDGGGMFETGGRIPDPKPMMTNGKPTNPANIGPSENGTEIVGGVLHHVTVGDVMMIPPNTPHRFKTLDGSVTYMVVRVNPGYEKGK
jgi:mannose-6-phosphate isomerase-like protein (cupin superfamily)